MEHFLEHYGYFALFAGTFIEGETILIIAGFLAHRGYLSIHWVVAVSFAGSFLGDQFYFYVGRFFGTGLISKSKRLRRIAEKIHRHLSQHETVFILSFRFIYGIRTASPIIIGTSGISALKYALLNMTSAMVWAILFSTLGYFFGKAFESYIGQIKRYEEIVIIFIITTGCIIFVIWKIKERMDIRRS
jgi:membrane protein DedA with SNARE-associated domain